MSDVVHVTDLTAAYALGALTADEMRAVESHVAHCQACNADLAEMTSIASTLPLACPSAGPSADLKARMLEVARGDVAADARLRARPRVSAPDAPAQLPRRPRPLYGGLWWPVAAAAVFLLGAGMSVNAMMERAAMDVQMRAVQAQLASAQADEAAMQRQAARAHRTLAVIASGKVWDMSAGPPAHWWHCTLVQPPRRANAVLVAYAPSAPKGMAYQAWLIRKGSVHKAGMVPPGKMSTMDMPMPVEAGDVIAFTMEPAGGSESPTMPWVMEHTLD